MDKKRFRRDFEDALKVMWDFNEVFAVGPAKRRESDLPYGKGRVKNALVYLNAAIRAEETLRSIRELFPTAAATLYLSDQFAAALYAQLTSLPEFLPGHEADLRDRVDRRLGNSLGPDGLYVEQSEGDRLARVQAIMTDPEAFREFQDWLEVQQRPHAEADAYLAEAKAFTSF